MKRFALAIVLLLVACHHDMPRLSVGAAASLRVAMPELAAAYEARGGALVDLRFGASDVLAKQVHDGAALDVIVVADEAALDDTLVARDGRRVIASNSIVLVGPAGSELTFGRLATLDDGTRIAIGDPQSVPVGRYARGYLQQLGSWDVLQPRLVLGGDVASVLALAQRGSTKLAIVYKSDAAHAAPLVVLDEPADAPVAKITAATVAAGSHRAEAGRFLAFLVSPEAQSILARHQLSAPHGSGTP